LVNDNEVHIISLFQDIEMSMYSDVERLRGVLTDLAGLVNDPNSLPDATRDYINVCVCGERGGERERERERGGGR
jgi:hypothetical protein